MWRLLKIVAVFALLLFYPVYCTTHMALNLKHAIEKPPLRQFGDFSSPSPAVTNFSPIFLKRLGKKEMPVPPAVQVSGTVSFSPILDIIGGSPIDGAGDREFVGGWREYLGSLNISTLNSDVSGSPPHPMGWVELKEGQLPQEVCQSNPQISGPDSVQYCRAIPGMWKHDWTGLLVVPHGYGERLQKLAEAGGTQEAWLAATIVASVVYSEHLRYEVGDSANGAGLAWPSPHDHLAFDYCVAGISTRTVFPSRYTDQAVAIIKYGSSSLGLSTRGSERMVAFAAGMESGKLRACSEYI